MKLCGILNTYLSFLYILKFDVWCGSKWCCSKSVHESLRRRARMMTDGFNSCRNVVCNFTEGNIKILNFVGLQQLEYGYCLLTRFSRNWLCFCRSYVLLPPNTAATKSDWGGKKSQQSTRRFLLPQAPGGNRNFHCSSLWFWAKGRVSDFFIWLLICDVWSFINLRPQNGIYMVWNISKHPILCHWKKKKRMKRSWICCPWPSSSFLYSYQYLLRHITLIFFCDL